MTKIYDRTDPARTETAGGSGLSKLVLHVPTEDAVLLSRAADGLRDPERRAWLRALLEGGSHNEASSLEAHLEAAPLDGVDLSRSSDRGRDMLC